MAQTPDSALPRGEWAWESGSATGIQLDGPCGYGLSDHGSTGVYGTFEVPAAGNVPGSRSSAMQWTDNRGNLWLFGGSGYDSSTALLPVCSEMNDLWKFDTTSHEWAWMGGSEPDGTPYQDGVYGTLGTFAAGNVPGSREHGVTWTDKKGHLWLLGGYDTPLNELLDDIWEFNPLTSEWAWMGGVPPINRQCTAKCTWLLRRTLLEVGGRQPVGPTRMAISGSSGAAQRTAALRMTSGSSARLPGCGLGWAAVAPRIRTGCTAH
jgi:hypothetical protein